MVVAHEDAADPPTGGLMGALRFEVLAAGPPRQRGAFAQLAM
ncbi:MAG: hypothetical protein ACRDUT_03640 [Mycobacterium sp.]